MNASSQALGVRVVGVGRRKVVGVWAICGLVAWLSTACVTPGAIAPSTRPVTGSYVVLGGVEEASSCGYIVLFLPVKNPMPLADLILDMVKGRGGEALIEVTSSSSVTSYLLLTTHCIEVRGKVVNFTK
ncbi:MAG: hypothetical protein ACREIS_05045 [Nitrospiraceae bacterium]